MADLFRWEVLRGHEGDRPYAEGDIRVGSKTDLSHLEPRVLKLLGPVGIKAETAPLNKAESAAPANKAFPGRQAK